MFNLNKVYILYALACLSWPAQSVSNLPYVQTGPKIDGDLSDPAWQQAVEIQLPYEIAPGENVAALVSTTAKLLTTDEAIYVSFVAVDPDTSAIRSTRTGRDQALDDDRVGIVLDSFGQKKSAYLFSVNALGIQNDAVEYQLTGNVNYNWDGIWYAQSKIVDNGYQVEMKLPFSMFSFDSASNMSLWGVELTRYYPRQQNHQLSSITNDRNNDCHLCQLDSVMVKAVKQTSQNLQVTPSFSAKKDSRRGNGGQWHDDNSVDLGLDVRWNINSRTLLNVTVNPDFSQIESDLGQLDTNNNFALFFPEKRPFFLDNSDYFTSGVNLVHTRNLIEPNFGSKLTTKVGKQTFGAMYVDDDQTNILLPGNLNSELVSLNKSSRNAVLRYRYDQSEDLSIGAMTTLRKTDDYYNYVVSSDVQQRFSQYETLRVQVGASSTEYPDMFGEQLGGCDGNECYHHELSLRSMQDEPLQGAFVRAEWENNNRDYHYSFLYERYDKDFRADLGFVSMVDYNKSQFTGGLKWYPQEHFFSDVSLNIGYWLSRNNDGELLERASEIFYTLAGKYQVIWEGGLEFLDLTGVRKNPGRLALSNNVTEYTFTRFWNYVEYMPSDNLSLAAELNYGGDVDYRHDREGTTFRFLPQLKWNINHSVTFNLNYTYQSLDVEDGELFNAHLMDMRLTWYFTDEQFFRFTSVFSQVTRDQALYRDPVPSRDQELANELLYGYQLNAQSAAYLGYSLGSNNFVDEEHLGKDNYRIFAKLTYAWFL